MRPKPSPFPLRRVGGNGDGAYLVPAILDQVTACFSPGVSNRKDFEDELLEDFGIRSHLLDFSSDLEDFVTPLVEGRQTFRKKWLSTDGRENSLSLAEWISLSEVDEGANFLLQMDIEGAEYENLIGSTSRTLEKFSILVIEFHGLASRIQSSSSRGEVEQILAVLSASFRSVHARINNCCEVIQVGKRLRIPEVLEVTLLRSDYFEDVALHRTYVPHPLDIQRNVLENPPRHLTNEWRIQGLTFRSVNKVFRDWNSFLRYSCHQSILRVIDLLYVSIPARQRTRVARFFRFSVNR
jgi:hypothetical protein